jgi:hypothetical protein
MKTLLFFIALVISMVLIKPQVLAAPNIGLGPDGIAGKVANQAGYDSSVSDTAFSEAVGKIIKAVLSILGIIFLALTVYAGFLWMTARGAEEQITTAKNIISAAIIGLAITLSAYAITAFVVSKLSESTSGVQVGGSPQGSTGLRCGTPEVPQSGCVSSNDLMPSDRINAQAIGCPAGYVCVGP